MTSPPSPRPGGQPSPMLVALRQSARSFAFVGVFSFFVNLLMLASPLYMLQIYDRVLTARSEATLLHLSLIVAAMLILMALLEGVRSRVLVRVSGRMDALLGERVFDAIFAANLRRPAANRAQALRDLENVRQFLTSPGPFTFFDAPWAPVYIGLVFLMHPLLGMIALGGAVLLFASAAATEMATRQALTEAGRHGLRATSFAEASLRNAEVVAALGMLPGIRRLWRAEQGRALLLQSRASDRAGAISAFTKFTRLAVQAAILGAGAWLALDQQITPGMMIAASIIMGRGLAPVEQAVGTWKQFAAARGAWRRLDELLSGHTALRDHMPLHRPTGRVVVETVSAIPPGGGAPTLRAVGLELEPGESLAVVGPSAAGKSTLARLLVGVWAPAAGCVRLDGADVARWNHEELGPHIGYLPQDIEIFDGSIKDNIARFGPVDPDAVIRAAHLAGVHEMILRLPDGYDTVIGPGGIGLSGGQRQRLGLARAIYGDPVFVVLDEPNSNLDAEGEAALLSTLAALKAQGTTVVLIAHRATVLNHVDRILVLKAGRMEMMGPRQEVLARMNRPAPPPAAALPATDGARPVSLQPEGARP